MKEAAERLSISARHLSLVDEICAHVDSDYAAAKSDLEQLPGYLSISDQLYRGQQGRQMVLGDLLTYILAGRGYWSARREDQATFRGYVEVIMKTVNLVLMQETILSSRVDQRRKFLRRLKGENIEGFFANDSEKDMYKQLIQSKDLIQPGHSLYRTMDSLLPKSAGVAIELLVFVYLLKRAVGYIIPLLFTQRIFRGRESFAPPDYLILRPGAEVLGVEVGGGLGRFGAPSRGKLEQVNRFVQDTSIPVLTATMPHMQYRCPDCNSWPVFCPEVIDRVCTTWDGDQENLSCTQCERFDNGNCPFILYKGQTEVKGETRHHHYQHVKDLDYVKNRSLRTTEGRKKKLISYFPHVDGMQRIGRETR